MGLFNFLKEICDPGVISDYNDLKNNHREALDNWLRGGYRPRAIIPESERGSFNDYDREYNYINKQISQYGWLNGIDEMTYEQKCFIVGRKQQILSLYATFHKYEEKVGEIAIIAEQYPYGFNTIAIKYGKFRIKDMYVEPFDNIFKSRKQSPSNTTYSISNYTTKETNSRSSDTTSDKLSRLSTLRSLLIPTISFFDHATAKVVESVRELTPDQCIVILSHMDELRSENQRLYQRYKRDQEVEQKKKEKETIDKALFIARCNPHGYKKLINYSIDSITLSKANQIVAKEDAIKAAEKRHREEKLALQRKEAEERNLANVLPACVSSWNSHGNSSLKHKYFYDYYTYAANKDNASADIRETWRIIWNFKNDPSRSVSIYEHEEALRKVTDLVENELRSTFGSKTEYLTLVCLTASSRRKTELRYSDFAEKVCKDLNMTNAFPYIKVTEDGISKHDGGEGARIVSHDSSFFRGKYVVLFDDIRTTGSSLEHERLILESLGSNVICAITIAQTTH